MPAVAEPAHAFEFCDIREGIVDPILHIRHSDLTHSRSINDRHSVSDIDQLSVGGGMSSSRIRFPYFGCLHNLFSGDRIDESRLSCTRRSHKADRCSGFKVFLQFIQTDAVYRGDRMNPYLIGYAFDFAYIPSDVVAEVTFGKYRNGYRPTLYRCACVSCDTVVAVIFIE